MKQEELLKRVYDYLDSEEKPFDLAWDRIKRIREMLSLFEDGLTWEAIKNHLENGCNCEEVTEL